MAIPQASIEISRISDEVAFCCYSEEILENRAAPKHLTKIFMKMMKHFRTYIYNIKMDVRHYWKRVERAMKRDAGKNWDYMNEHCRYQINEHLNNKIRERLRRKTATKASLKRELQRWIDFITYLCIYGRCESHRKHFQSGLEHIKNFIEGFTNIVIRYRWGRCSNEDLVKYESQYRIKKGYLAHMLWKHFRECIIKRYYMYCDQCIRFVGRPSSKRLKCLRYEMMRYILLLK